MQQMLNTALMIAAKAHDGQFDKAGKPYIFHVLAVMHKLRSNDEELNCIALLHDVVEDTKTTYQELRGDGMSERVVEAVKLLTKVPGQTADEYLEGILTSRDAMLVKKSDLQHNMDMRRLKGVTEKDLARMNKYIKMFHVIDEKLKQPIVEINLNVPRLTSEPVAPTPNEKDTFKPGDVCKFRRHPRNAYGDLSPSNFTDWTDYRFILGEAKETIAYDYDDSDWVALDVRCDGTEYNLWNVNTGKCNAWRSWVRTDDIEKVNDQ